MGEHGIGARVAVKCAACGRRSERSRKEDGGYGNCGHCGARMERAEAFAASRIAKAQADFARMGR